MASSAVYRYFPSRDDLLTALIVEAYDALGSRRGGGRGHGAADGPRARLQAVCGAVRRWALAHPHEYALVYGSPVPGYAAPRAHRRAGGARRAPCSRRIVADGVAAGVVDDRRRVGTDALLTAGIAAEAGSARRPRRVRWRPAMIQAWTALFGLVSFELFGHTHNVVDRHEEFFADAVDRSATCSAFRAGRG